MKYRVYTLKFLTPVHFADTNAGGNLERTSIICSADTYFNALCFEASLYSNELLQKILNCFSNNRLVISSLFPYQKVVNENGNDKETVDMQFYLPRPMYLIDKFSSINSYTEQKIYANKLKELEKIDFIRVSELKSWIESIRTTTLCRMHNPLFAVKQIDTKVACRQDEPLPYFISSYRFNDNMGLYFILGFEDENDTIIIDDLVERLGYSGIGGKKSSGYGKYILDEEPWDLDCYFYQDDDILNKMLNTDKGAQINIAPIIPNIQDMDNIKFYKILRRSGYAYDIHTHRKVRKNDIYMIGEGSCAIKRINGLLIKEQYDNISYPIYRNGRGMFVGLNYD